MIVAIVVVYLLGMHAVAYWASRRIKGNEDFMLAGRRLGPFMLAGTLAATEVGGGSSLGVTEKAKKKTAPDCDGRRSERPDRERNGTRAPTKTGEPLRILGSLWTTDFIPMARRRM